MNDLAGLTKFATRYAEAWCTQNPQSVAAFFAENSSLSVNDEPPAVGRAAIAEVARGFMRDFPDMIVTFDKLEPQSNATAFHWILTGTNTGPVGTGKRVRISGHELWKFDKDGLIAESKGPFRQRRVRTPAQARSGRIATPLASGGVARSAARSNQSYPGATARRTVDPQFTFETGHAFANAEETKPAEFDSLSI
jgi:hypothetical protein